MLIYYGSIESLAVKFCVMSALQLLQPISAELWCWLAKMASRDRRYISLKADIYWRSCLVSKTGFCLAVSLIRHCGHNVGKVSVQLLNICVLLECFLQYHTSQNESVLENLITFSASARPLAPSSTI
jgi:hypothetical protein